MSTIITINESDAAADAPADLNANFAALNADKLETLTNVGTGTGTIAKTKNGTNVNVKTIKAGSNITITNNADDITIEASAPNPDASSSTKGITKLSVDPASPTAPIALGVNDPLLTSPASGTPLNSSTNKIMDQAYLPAGSMVMYGGGSAPTGWLLCDGSAVSRSTYAALFSAIASTFGDGNGTTTFNVPDMRGRAPIGAGTGTGGGASGSGAPTGGSALTARAAGDWLGEEAHTLTTPEIPSHNHALPNTASFAGNPNGAGSSALVNSGGPINTASTGGGGSHNNVQPAMTVNFIIRI